MKKQARKTKKTSNVIVNNSVPVHNAEHENLLLLSQAELDKKLGNLGKKPKTGWMIDLENFTFKFLTLQGMVTAVTGPIAFINPIIGLGGFALGLVVSVPYGLYFMTKERSQRKLDDAFKLEQISEVSQETTLVDYLNSQKFKDMVANLNSLTEEQRVALNERLRDHDLLKGNITKNLDADALKKAVIDTYVQSKKSKSKKGPAVADKFYNEKTKYVYGFISNMSTGPGFTTLATGIAFSVFAVVGIGLSAALTGGVTLVAVVGGFAAAAVIASVVAYFQVKRDQRAAKHTDSVAKLGDQQVAIQHLTEEVKFINKKVNNVKEKEAKAVEAVKAEEAKAIEQPVEFVQLFAKRQRPEEIVRQRRHAQSDRVSPIIGANRISVQAN